MKKIGINLLLLAVLAGCSSNEDVVLPEGGSTDEGVMVNFCSGIQTKAVIENAYFDTGAEIGVYGLNATNVTMADTNWDTSDRTLAENLNNGKYTATAFSNSKQELRATAIAKFPAGDDAALVFYAYYPYNVAITTPETGAPIVPVAVTTIEDTPDYLYTGALPTAVTASPISLPFKHAMARLDFNIKKKDPATPDAKLLGITVVMKNGQKGEMSLTDGTITLSASNDGATTIASGMLNIDITSADTGVGTKFLLIPGNDAIEKIILTLQRSDFSANGETTYDIPINSSINLKAGMITTLHLVYDPLDVNFTATIAIWTDDEINYGELPIR